MIDFQKYSQVFCLCLLLAGLRLPAQTAATWSAAQTVAQSAQLITAPHVQVLDDGTAVVVWGESSSPARIWCSRLQNGQFSPPVSVVTSSPAPALFGFGGFDLAVSGQNVYVAFERSNGIFLAKSADGGLTFGSPVLVQGPVSGAYPTLPSIATDESGNIFVNHILEKTNASTHQMRRSTDGGLTFWATVEANLPADGTKVCECCPAAIFAAHDSVWLAFRNNDGNIRDHWVSRSSTQAASFDTATDVDDTDWNINVCPIAGPSIARSGDSLVVVWKTGAGGGSRIFASTLHGGTMAMGQQIRLGAPDQLAELQNQPSIAASGDTLGIVFQESNERLVFTLSTAGASGLGPQYDRFEMPGNKLQYPSLAFWKGRFHLVFADATAKKVLYQTGTLAPTNGTAAPFSPEILSNDCPVVVEQLRLPRIGEGLKIAGADVFDLAGRLACSHAGADLGGQSLDLSSLPSGFYFLKMRDAAGRTLELTRFFKR